MMLKREQLQRLKPQGNNVLIKLDQSQNRVKLKSGTDILIDTTYEPEKHAYVTGEVIAVPKQLIFKGVGALQWETDMELLPGDQVIIYYLAAVNSLKKETAKWLWDEDMNKYIFITYDNVYVARRMVKGNFLWKDKKKDKSEAEFIENENGQFTIEKIIPVNGYCLIELLPNEELEKLEERYAKLNLKVPKQMIKKYSSKYGIIHYAGKPNRSYKYNPKDHDQVEVKVGDKVVLRKHANVPLEFDYHSTLDKKIKFYRVQRRYIMGLAS